MSANKLRYYTVVTTQVVQALNQTDAVAIATKARGFSTLEGQVIATETEASRISAGEARSATA